MTRKKKRRKDKCPPPVDLRQAASLPFRRVKGGVEFCLVTVRRGTSWPMPKGNFDRGEQGADCAGRETCEEAGLEGRLIDPQLCRYTDFKGKKSVEVTVWLLEVKKMRKKWPEKKQRTRRWVSPRKAIRLLARPHLVAPIVDALRCLGEID